MAGAALLLPGGVPTAGAAPAPVRLLGEQVLPFGLEFGGTTVGGLSGIDFAARTGEYVLISDDRSERDPARFYTARFAVDDGGIGPITFTGTHLLRTADGGEYGALSVDPEEIRVDPRTGDFVWTQEGERFEDLLIDPATRIAHPDGSYVGELPIAANTAVRANSGPRRNAGPEGATFAADGMLFMTALEGPLLQDGPAPTAAAGAPIRLTVQARSGPVLAQYAYPVEPVFAPGDGNNGVASILAENSLDPTKLLVLERGYVAGQGNRIRIYRADIAAAGNVLDKPIGGAKPVGKQLVADLTELGLGHVDNIEGMTWGPRLASGERTLILVSDNNFDDKQKTQVIALALR
ncbi:esterase-like activity of phytase family protein [Nocardia harenae]|uniref:esterase-like activity of phytase family protein n=1 Tax=Nocardia harenae TaxID=358707 RepID=UPI001FE153CA|nr:esterase-like activity of phytase family protein [Nocardia harenae]